MPTLRVTRIVQESKPLSSTGNHGETATTEDFALFDGLTTPADQQEAGLLSDIDHHRGNRDPFDRDAMNDSTLSGSLLEEALDVLRASKDTQQLSSAAAAKQQRKEVFGGPVPSQIQCGRATNEDGGPPAEDPRAVAPESEVSPLPLSIGQELAPMESDQEGDVENDDDYSCHSFDAPPPRLRSEGPQESNDVGPNERLYREKYAAFVSRHIQSTSRPLPGYRTMADADKEREQERVLALLHRLGIRPLDGEPVKDQHEVDGLRSNDFGEGEIGSKARLHRFTAPDEQDSEIPYSTTTSQVTQPASELPPSVDPGLGIAVQDQMQNSNRGASRKSVSFALEIDEPHLPDFECNCFNSSATSSTDEPLTEPARLGDEAKGFQGAARHRTQPPLHQDSSREEDDESLLSSDEDVEVALSKQNDVLDHGAHEYDSPTATTQRAEWFRKRSATTSGKRGTDTSRTRPSDVPMSYGLPLATSDQTKPFILSASPISPYHRHDRTSYSESPNHSMAGQQDVSLGDFSTSECSATAKAAATQEEESILFTSTSFVVDERVSLRDASNHCDVRVRHGEPFHLQPLETRPSRQELFPDPFHVYDGSTLLPQMLRVISKVCRREQAAALKPNSIARAVVLSMEMPHIHRLVLKLVLEEASIPRASSPPAFGQATTLIVAREREELEAWNRVFREGSTLRVLNHSTLPVVRRKTRSTAELCSTYEVVLTTYDCLKSADVTVHLDAKGYALTNDAFNQSGEWVSSRTTSSHVDGVECKQLSVLHFLRWKRIVFLDTVGRKSFLSKPETARSFASKSLNCNSRIMFFIDPNPEKDSIEALSSLVKSDRRAIGSVAAILRASVDGSESDFLRHVVIDLNRRTTKHSRTRPNV